MSSGPRRVIGTGINETDAVPKARNSKGSGGAAPPSYASMFRGAFCLPPFSAKFSSYPTRHAANGSARTSRGSLSQLNLHIILWG